jgi:F420-non-reducing hydrogenase small subunit
LAKLKLAVYWGAACGGCDVSILDLHEKILKIGELADIVLWPLAADPKYSDIEAMEDKTIDLCLFNGAVRNSENLEIAELLRKKSKILVSLGSCACFGGIPGLGNLFNKKEIFNSVYLDREFNANDEQIVPKTKVTVPEGELTLPEFYNTVSSLEQVVDVDYFIPGCPPPPDLLWTAIEAIVSGNLPPKGSIIAGDKALCHECPRKREGRKVKEFKRLVDVILDEEICILEQGVVCNGPATRGGCGARCVRANIPCRGCFGPIEDALDQGTQLLSAIASTIDSSDPKEIKRITDQLADPAGTFYRFSLPVSMLKRKKEEGEE